MAHKILLLLNNYSYFKHDIPTGPKSLLKLIELCSRKNQILISIRGKSQKIDFNIKNVNVLPHSIQFPGFSCILSYIKLKPDIIISDRRNILLGIFLKLILNRPLVLRMLGRGKRFQSSSFFSYRNCIRLISNILPIDIVIETIDGSFPLSDRFIKAKVYRQRINGATMVHSNHKKNKNKFVSVARFSTEKNFDRVVLKFNELNQNNDKELIVFGCTLSEFKAVYPDIPIDYVSFKGFRPLSCIESALIDAQFFISGNSLGCLGNAELEAISYNCQIIYLEEILNGSIPISLYRFFIPEDIQYIGNPNIPDFEQTHLEDFSAIQSLLE